MNLDQKSQENREKLVLMVYAFYTVAMAAVTYFFGWSTWIQPVIFVGLCACSLMYFTKYKTYEFRALITTVMMWMNFSIYLVNSDDFTGAFSTMVAMIVLLAIYCIPRLTNVGTIVYTGHLVYHFLFLKDIGLDFSQDGVQAVLRIASVYVALYVTYCLMKAQVESNDIMLENMEAARSAEQSKDDFMANMSHEIRTPINTVCGISEMVLKEDLPENVREDVTGIQTAGRQLLGLVSDILDFSELSSGQMEILPDIYNITSTVNDILNMTIAKLTEKNIELIVDCDALLPAELIGDEQKLRRAVMNVINNAAEFTEEGGIRLSLSFREEEYGGNLIISVQDTGIGIEEEKLETMFSSFQQVDTRRNRKNSGLGLGLSISKAIVSRMGGIITIDSVYGKGTTVKMVIPQKVNRTQPIVELEDPKEYRILLFLDINKYNNASVREWYSENIRRMVKQLGIFYRHASSLAECKNRMEQTEFNWLFLSWTEYCEDRNYFEELSKVMNVVLVLDRSHKESVQGSSIRCVYKPFYILTIASVLNGQYVEYLSRHNGYLNRFAAPTAQILVVDDNLMNLKVAEGLLKPYQCKVCTAESGKEALKKLEQMKFDLVFMDHMMPEMDGIETFRRIRQKEGAYYQNIPVIALTANAIGGAREMFLQEGFSDYVSKPIELSALERVLQKFIPEDKKNKIMEEAPEPEVPQSVALGFLAGIDTERGMKYCGGRLDDYLEVVRTYYTVGISKAKEIETAYQAQDWKNYTILVHAVKSTSLSIGASSLSEMARKLEAAGKESDAAYIKAHNGEMLAEYERVLGIIGDDQTVFPDGAGGKEEEIDVGSLKEISRMELEEMLVRMEEMLQGFDLDGVMAVLAEAAAFRYQEEALASLLLEVKKKADDFDYSDAGEEIQRLRERLDG